MKCKASALCGGGVCKLTHFQEFWIEDFYCNLFFFNMMLPSRKSNQKRGLRGQKRTSPANRIQLRKRYLRAEEIIQGLGSCTVLAKDMISFPCNHIRQLTTACDSSYRLSVTSGLKCTSPSMYTPTHAYIHIIKTKCFVKEKGILGEARQSPPYLHILLNSDGRR